MKVICTEKDPNNLNSNCITYGKKYEVLSSDDAYYYIRDDDNVKRGVFKFRFEGFAEKETKMKVTLPNGLVVEGSSTEVEEAVKKLGYPTGTGEYYYSESRGLVKISEMNTQHLINAVLKLYREWVSSLSGETNPQKLYQTIYEGNPDLVFKRMVVELKLRKTI